MTKPTVISWTTYNNKAYIMIGY